MADAQHDPTQGFWTWSLPVGRILGIDVRLHWTLLAMTAFEIARFADTGAPWFWWPVVLIALPLSVLLHEFGHALTARTVGGDSRDIVLWAFGGIAWCTVPGRALAHLLVAAGGPLVNLVIWGAAMGVLHGTTWVTGDPANVLAFVAGVNLSLLLFNLLPCYPMDGGRVSRALLWPVVGREKAVRWTIILAYVCIAGLALWAMMNKDFFLFGLAALLVFAVLAEQRMVAQGIDPEGVASWAQPKPLMVRWRERRSQAAAERAERRAEVEQAELDRLLEKVSQHGLPSLTEGERKTLRQISEREREKAGGPCGPKNL
jgi:Zn-dependent protease